ncbi:hypothetical protein M422DRAFT_180994, partial [Sphaerobolus stellatus SS14]
MYKFAKDILDISVLDLCVSQLCTITNVPTIQSFDPSSISAGHYRVCHLCHSCITRNKFTKVPLYAYANNCWLGPVPEELKDLSFLEEQCIARAHSTRCMIKLEKGPTGQFASKGNVCIFPQEPHSLTSVLPPPLNTLHDEIAVIFVSSAENPVTVESLQKSPLLVQQGCILKALEWLKKNNPLYGEITIDLLTLTHDYPENGPAP